MIFVLLFLVGFCLALLVIIFYSCCVVFGWYSKIEYEDELQRKLAEIMEKVGNDESD